MHTHRNKYQGNSHQKKLSISQEKNHIRLDKGYLICTLYKYRNALHSAKVTKKNIISKTIIYKIIILA